MTRKRRQRVTSANHTPPVSPRNIEQSEPTSAFARLKESAWFTVAHDNLIAFVLGILALSLLSPLSDQLPEPLGSKELFSYYFSLNLINDTTTRGSEQASLIDDITSVVVHPMKEPISINTIRVRGISEVSRCVVAIRDTELRSKSLPVDCAVDKDRELLTISNIGVVPQSTTLIANIWGATSTDIFPAIQLRDGTFVWPSHARLVKGRLLFLSDYWNLIVTIIVITMLGYYYVLKRRIARAAR